MPKPSPRTLLIALLCAVCAAHGSAVTGLSEGPRLAAIYETILRGQISEAGRQIATACPPAPMEACQALRAVALWWEIQIDPNSRSLDAAIERASETAIAAAERWTKREPNRAEAWFYLAGSYAPLTQWRVLRGERIAAARDGNRIREALERAIALDPTLTDAYFGIGAYHYYADIAPAALKMLRWLLFLPGGDRAKGLEEMLTTRERGLLLRGEADFQLHYIFLWYEHEPLRALQLLRGLDARYPTNPLFLQRIAEVERDYRHDHDASRAAWQQLLDRAQSRRVEFAPLAEIRARIGLAGELIETSQPARALEIIAAVIDRRAAAPYGALSEAELARGRALARLGDIDRARTAFDRAIAAAPRDDPERIRARARDARSRLRSQ